MKVTYTATRKKISLKDFTKKLHPKAPVGKTLSIFIFKNASVSPWFWKEHKNIFITFVMRKPVYLTKRLNVKTKHNIFITCPESNPFNRNYFVYQLPYIICDKHFDPSFNGYFSIKKETTSES